MKTKVFKAEIEFIDPLSCGSVIGYKVSIQKSPYNSLTCVYGTIELGDCTRRISWEINSDDEGKDSIRKLNNAIRILTNARNAVVCANKVATTANKKIKIKKKDNEVIDENTSTPGYI
jgi:hypothetical protein